MSLYSRYRTSKDASRSAWALVGSGTGSSSPFAITLGHGEGFYEVSGAPPRCRHAGMPGGHRRRWASGRRTPWHRGEGFGAEAKRRIMLGTYALSADYYDEYYLKAQKVRTLIRDGFDAVWAAGFDAIVAPTSPSVAFRFGAKMADPVSMYHADACTVPVNMAGLLGYEAITAGAPWRTLEPAQLGLADDPDTSDPIERLERGWSETATDIGGIS